MPGETAYVIGLGSNLGDRCELLRSAVDSLGEFGAQMGVSALYESAAVGPPQPDFLNGAVRFLTELVPHLLLQTLQAIEREHGRVRRERWGPRTLDLDILWAGMITLSESGLTIPHPRLTDRPFALLPLIDVAPDAVEPSTGRNYRSILAGLDASAVRRLPGTAHGHWCR